MAKSPYEILGVSKTASQDEIKKAYRKLAKTLHPDLNPGNKEMEHRFKDVTGAYDTVGDPKKRTEYDAQAANPFAGQSQAGGGQGRGGPFYYETQGDGSRYSSQFDEDFFSSIFGGAAGRRGRAGGAHGQPVDLPGEDENYQLEVELRDAAVGAERELALPSGKRLRVKIPAGVESGSKLRFTGMGQPGIGRGPTGDVYVEIRVRPSAQFQVKGHDVESELAVSLAEAVLGGEARVPTLDGHVMLTIPEGMNTGSRLRIKGKGLTDRTTGKRGDQFVVLKVMLPQKIDAELKEAIRLWSGQHPYNPREDSPNAA